MKWIHTLIFFTIFLDFNNPVEGAELKMGGTEWSPYMGSELQHHGIAAQIVTQIFSQTGHQVEFKFFPWKRTQVLVKTGQLDGLAIAWFTKERAETMVYSKPYIRTAIVLIKRKDDPFAYNGIQDLDGKNIGVIMGYGYLKKIQSSKIQKSFVKTLEQNLRKLAGGRIDLTMEEKINAQITIASMPREIQAALTIIENPFETKELHITLSKNIPQHQALLDNFNRVLAAMIKDGRYQRMLDHLDPTPLGVQ